MCEYCEGKKPLTDKVYGDGTKFDDYYSTRIEHLEGLNPTLVSEIKRAAFHNYYGLPEEVYQSFADSWAVEINYCPICGKNLNDR